VLTIHRAQGQTLSRVILRLDNVFSYGQVYSGMGRPGKLKYLKLMGKISEDMVLCAPEVIDFEETTVWWLLDNSAEC